VSDIDFSIVIPCLNEEKTIGNCVLVAFKSASDLGYKIEVLVADNGSSDNSKVEALKHGAKVIDVPTRGYGAAIDSGIRNAQSNFVVIADGDESYDFGEAWKFYVEMKFNERDLVIGNRFKGGIARGAMPPLHKYLGNPVLSTIARVLFQVPVGDFHCGMRGVRREKYLEANPKTTGMEFATEMVLRLVEKNAQILEIPTTLVPDKRDRKPHLRSFPDGWRHLKLMLLFAPQFLFLFPGILLASVGGLLLLEYGVSGKIQVGPVQSDVTGGLFALVALVMGVQLFSAGAISIAHAKTKGIKNFRWLPIEYNRFRERISIGVPVIFMLLGVCGLISLILRWNVESFGHLNPIESSRIGYPSAGLLVSGFTLIVGAVQVRQIISKFW
jgi:glycosyltransferase involved in cell wall biosynthesis